MATSHIIDDIRLTRQGFSRRRFLSTVSAAAVATGGFGFSDLMAVEAEKLRRRGKPC